VSASLAAAGHRVTGVDFSEVQISRARTLVPAATFIQADATAVSFPDDSFDAVVCLYMLIHLPLADQPTVIARIARWLRPGGKLLVTTGATAWTGTEDDWLGGTAPMWWSHPDADTYRSWLVEAGLHVDSSEFVPEGAGGHQLFWCSL
jgi:ubiquinone/menaquinone biosynthesis C-methylase UbiE